MKTSKIIQAAIILYSSFNINVYCQWIKANGIEEETYSIFVNGDDLYAGSFVNNRIFKSTDEGENWKQINGLDWGTSSFNREVRCFLVSDTSLLAGSGNVGVYRWSKNEEKWNQANSGLSVLEVNSMCIRGNNIFVGTNGGVFCSTNNANSWTLSGLEDMEVQALLVGVDYILAATYINGIYRSTDDGMSWNKTNTGGNSMFYSFAHIDSNLFAGVWGTGVARSTDNGENWTQQSNTGNWSTPYSLVSYSNNLFMGGDDGVLLSGNYGESWTSINTGFPTYGNGTSGRVKSLAIFGHKLLAATPNGVWYRPLSEVLDVNNGKNRSIVQYYCLYQNYPNPFNPITTISFNLPTKSFVSLKILDILGKEVDLLIDKELQAGFHHIEWNANNKSSGIYLYQFRTESFVDTKKLLLLK